MLFAAGARRKSASALHHPSGSPHPCEVLYTLKRTASPLCFHSISESPRVLSTTASPWVLSIQCHPKFCPPQCHPGFCPPSCHPSGAVCTCSKNSLGLSARWCMYTLLSWDGCDPFPDQLRRRAEHHSAQLLLCPC